MKAESKVMAGQLDPITVFGWADLPWLVHGFSTRTGGRSKVYRPDQSIGELNLGFTAEDSRENVTANRQLLLRHLVGEERGEYHLVSVRQTHSAVIHRVGRPDLSEISGGAGAPALEGDGLMTDEAGVLVGILTADCVPVLVVDPVHRAAAAFHAGWRGTVQAIVEQGVARMQAEFGSAPDNLRAAVGPAIGACCYRVGEEVREQFTQRFSYVDELFCVPEAGSKEPAMHLDLAEANRRQLLSAGLRSDSIVMTGACTGCDPERFFSHRRQQGITGRMMAIAGVRLP